jgi:5-hydroxyisourate hydrolase
MARLSTHVLDTARGAPAKGIKIDLFIFEGAAPRHVKSAVTKAGGRTPEPFLSGETIPPGIYELIFHAGDYHRRFGAPLSDPPFLDLIIIRLGVADPSANHHVPLLVSAYAYSTYRGS